jgi:hypothetical protein
MAASSSSNNIAPGATYTNLAYFLKISNLKATENFSVTSKG